MSRAPTRPACRPPVRWESASPPPVRGHESGNRAGQRQHGRALVALTDQVATHMIGNDGQEADIRSAFHRKYNFWSHLRSGGPERGFISPAPAAGAGPGGPAQGHQENKISINPLPRSDPQLPPLPLKGIVSRAMVRHPEAPAGAYGRRSFGRGHRRTGSIYAHIDSHYYHLLGREFPG
jgi:hypothetical protein